MKHLRYTRLLLVTLLVTFLTVWTACQPIVPVPPAQPSANSVIFTAAQSEAERASLFPESEGTWTPNAADIAMLEEDLLPFLRHAQHPWLRPDPPIWERVPDYQRQYLGLTVGGEQLIYANFFCNAHDTDGLTELVVVLDGGDCYFQVTYNPTTREFQDFNVNGES